MREDMWSQVDFDSTIRDFEFTRKAMNEIHKVVYSADFEDMDSDTIFAYLKGKMQLVSFHDFLKRYLYTAAGITEPFYQVGDDVYRDIISTSFEETYTPHSFEPTTKRWSSTVKGWLSAESVRRSTIFLLGFGLRMSAKDVSEFLTKVLKEEDFNPYDPAEVVYYYCYEKGLPYAFASDKLSWYADVKIPSETGRWQTGQDQDQNQNVPSLSFSDEAQLDDWLLYLKQLCGDAGSEQTSYQIIFDLVERAKSAVARIYNEDEELSEKRVWRAEDITSADLEKIICCGIPVTESGNLQKMSVSLLNRHFDKKRISRQRIDNLLQHKLTVERFDILTLLFFLYAQEMPDDEPEVRCKQYMDESNELLMRCHMSGLYPVNAYEAFLLMCLLSEDPLPTYSEIWEMSYSRE